MLDDFQDDEQNKNSEFLDEFRQRLNSQPIENLEERRNEINRSQHIFLGSILGVGLAGVVSWFILSPDYDKTKDAEIPVIRRPHTEIKVQPTEPGGMEILNQDKTVYDIIEKTDNKEVKVENLLPPPEEPKLPEADEKIEAKTEVAVNETNAVIENAEKIIALEEQKKTSPQPVVQEEAKVTTKEEIKASPEPQKVVAEIKVEVKEPEKTVATPKAVVAEKTAIEENVSVPSGSWQVQLISSPNKSAMDKAWNDLTKKYPDLKGQYHEIESADLGAKGTFYRLKAGSFKTRSEADKLCNNIKSAGGTCLVKKKQ